jgi:hypothetical protein
LPPYNDLRVASPILAREATWLGRRLAAPDATYADQFEIFVAREYADLKVRRAEIEQDIVARGSVYG